MNDENNGGPVVSNKPLHSPQSAILAIVNMINYLLPEVVLADSNELRPKVGDGMKG